MFLLNSLQKLFPLPQLLHLASRHAQPLRLSNEELLQVAKPRNLVLHRRRQFQLQSNRPLSTARLGRAARPASTSPLSSSFQQSLLLSFFQLQSVLQTYFSQSFLHSLTHRFSTQSRLLVQNRLVSIRMLRLEESKQLCLLSWSLLAFQGA